MLQTLHADSELAPAVFVYFSSPQSTQVVAPDPGEYLPTSQSIHVPAASLPALYIPASQEMHDDESAQPPRYRPAGHSVERPQENLSAFS